jgi:hypothetical protein
MIRLKPQTNGNETTRKWYQHPHLGVVAAAAMTIGLAATFKECGTKPKPPEPTCPVSKPPVCEQPCAPGFTIKCMAPLVEKPVVREEPKPAKRAVREEPKPECGDGYAMVDGKCEAKEAEAPKESECTEGGAKHIGASEVPALFKRLVRKAVEKHSAELVDKTAEVKFLICPNENGEKGAYAKVVGANVDGEPNDQLAEDARANLDGKKDPNSGISQVKVFTQSFQIKNDDN